MEQPRRLLAGLDAALVFGGSATDRLERVTLPETAFHSTGRRTVSSPLPQLMAMNHAVPVAVEGHATLKAFVSGESDTCFEPGCITAAGRTLATWHDDREEAERAGVAAQQYAHNAWSHEVAAAAIDAVYQDMSG